MVRRIILGLLLVGVIVLIYFGYENWSVKRSMLLGDVFVGPSEPLPVRTVAQPASPVSERKIYPAPISDPKSASTMPSEPVGALATDSQPANAPNELRIAGAGRFEVYRQGNLTYRIDTNTGRSCVLFATKEEWQKTQVYRHGCGNNGAQ